MPLFAEDINKTEPNKQTKKMESTHTHNTIRNNEWIYQGYYKYRLIYKTQLFYIL